MRTHGWAALIIWALLGWGMATRGGFAFSFLFYVFSCLVLYGWAVRWIGLRGVRVTRDVSDAGGIVPPDGAFEAGEEAVVEVTLRRKAALPIPWLVIRERVGEAEHDRLHGPWFSRRITYRYVLPLPARGVFAFEPTELWAGDPFGVIQQRVLARSVAQEVVAAPRPRRFGFETEKALFALGSGRSGAPRQGGSEYSDLRMYRDGDPLTRVLWKLAARTDDWYVRQQETAADSDETVIIVDSGGAEGAALDMCAEAAAGVITALGAGRRTCRLLAAGDGDRSGGSWRRRLAAIGSETPSLERMSGSLTLPGGADAVVVICSALRPDTAMKYREWRAGGRDVLLMLARDEDANGEAAWPEELRIWLRKGGVRLLELTKAGERQPEGGASVGENRYSFPS